MSTTKTKATGFEFLRKKLAKQSVDVGKQFFSSLSDEERELYQSAMPVSSVDLDMFSKVLEKAACVLYADEERPLVAFGCEEAKHAMSGIYKIVLQVVTIPMIIKRTASLWRLYYSKGTASPEMVPNKKEASLIVTEHPELPLNNREIVLGYTLGLLELSGVKNIRYKEHYENPDAWKWTFYWD